MYLLYIGVSYYVTLCSAAPNLRSSAPPNAAIRFLSSRQNSTTARAPFSCCRDLVEIRLIYRKRDGRRKRVASSDARAVEVYQDLVRQHSHIDFSELVLSLSDQSRRRRYTPRGRQSPERFLDSYRGRRRRCGGHGGISVVVLNVLVSLSLVTEAWCRRPWSRYQYRRRTNHSSVLHSFLPSGDHLLMASTLAGFGASTPAFSSNTLTRSNIQPPILILIHIKFLSIFISVLYIHIVRIMNILDILCAVEVN